MIVYLLAKQENVVEIKNIHMDSAKTGAIRIATPLPGKGLSMM